MTWVPPYEGTRTTLRHLHKKSGVYLIRNKTTKELLYVGMSKSSIYSALYRHFQDWSMSKQYRVWYMNRCDFEVRCIVVNRSRVGYVEKRLIAYFNPKDNIVKHNPWKKGNECPF